jgi:hypothetical protein
LCADEFANKFVCRFRPEIRNRSALNDPTFVHERDLVAQKGGLSQVVCNEQNRLLKTRANFLEIALEIHPNKGIERGEWLVEQKQLWRQHQSAHQTYALTLPTRELERITVERAIGKFSELAKLRDALLDFIASFPEQARLKREIVPGGKVGEQATILDNITETSANFHDRSGCYLLAVKFNLAGVSNEESDDQAQDGRLAATARADQSGNLTALDFEIDVAKGEIVSEKFADVAKVNESVHENRQLQHEEEESE